jgi:predicted MFS family arabinose efflux permease
VSAVSLVVGGLATSTLRHVPRNEGSPDPQRPLSGRSLRWLNELGFLMGAAAGCINTYLVLYGVDALGYDERVAGLLTALVGLSGAITRVVWAAGAERGKGPEASLRIMGPVSLVAVFVTAAASYVNVWLVWVGAVLAGVGIFIFTSLGMLALMQAVPEDSVGLATGSLSRTFFAGLLAGPLAFGLVVDLAASFTLAWMAVAVVVLAATVLTHLPTFLVPVRVWPQQPGPSALS